jgi:hypothetical protein
MHHKISATQGPLALACAAALFPHRNVVAVGRQAAVWVDQPPSMREAASVPPTEGPQCGTVVVAAAGICNCGGSRNGTMMSVAVLRKRQWAAPHVYNVSHGGQAPVPQPEQ